MQKTMIYLDEGHTHALEIVAAGRPYFNGGADTPGDTALSQGPAEAPSDPHLVAEKGVKQ